MEILIMVVGSIGIMIALRIVLAGIDWLERLGEDEAVKASSAWWTDRDEESF